MSRIYYHIPFCVSKCNYCDFYSITYFELIDKYINSMKEEVKLRSKSFDYEIESIYFGGGTPSLLKIYQIKELISIIYENFKVLPKMEITCECNPDDLSLNYLKELKKAGINRLNIGIQSLNNKDLHKLGRRHNAKQVENSVKQAIKAGFENIGGDLIYGLPWSSMQSFSKNLEKILKLPIKHLSAYHLTIHENTEFFKENMAELSDSQSFDRYEILCKMMYKKGFIHYEVSNFCKPDFYARHNSGYWTGEPYLGIGAAAHSYYNNKRYWNIDNIETYLTENFDIIREEEFLSEKTLFNEQIMLGLRTNKGIKLKNNIFLKKEFLNDFIKTAKKWEDIGALYIEKGHLKCQEEYWFIVDKIILDFFVT